MRRELRLLTLFGALAIPAIALADNFNLSGTLKSGGTAQGTISISAAGYVGAVNVSVFELGATYTFNEGSFFQQQYPGVIPPEFYSVSYDRAGDGLLLAFPSLLVGYMGGPLCSTSLPCKGFASSSFKSDSGMPRGADNFTSLSTSPVPEPASLELVLTGLVGLVAATQHRLRS